MEDDDKFARLLHAALPATMVDEKGRTWHLSGQAKYKTTDRYGPGPYHCAEFGCAPEDVRVLRRERDRQDIAIVQVPVLSRHRSKHTSTDMDGRQRDIFTNEYYTYGEASEPNKPHESCVRVHHSRIPGLIVQLQAVLADLDAERAKRRKNEP